MTVPELIREAGEALFGLFYVSADLAEALGVGTREFRRWQAGSEDPPLGVLTDIADLVEARSQELEKLATALRERSGSEVCTDHS